MSALELIEIPLPPSYSELAEAILAFSDEFCGVEPSVAIGTPADLVLLGLAERLAAAKGKGDEHAKES